MRRPVSDIEGSSVQRVEQDRLVHQPHYPLWKKCVLLRIRLRIQSSTAPLVHHICALLGHCTGSVRQKVDLGFVPMVWRGKAVSSMKTSLYNSVSAICDHPLENQGRKYDVVQDS